MSKTDKISHQTSAVAVSLAADRAVEGSPHQLALQAGANLLQNNADRQLRALRSLDITRVAADATPAQIAARRKTQSIKHNDNTYLPAWTDGDWALPQLFTQGRMGQVFDECNGNGQTYHYKSCTDHKLPQMRGKWVGAHNGVSLFCSGTQLSQHGLKIYCAVLNLVKHAPLAKDAKPDDRQCHTITFRHFVEDYIGVEYSAVTHRKVRDWLVLLGGVSLRVLKGIHDIDIPRLMAISFGGPSLAANGLDTSAAYTQRDVAELAGSDTLTVAVPRSLAVLFRRSDFTVLSQAALRRCNSLEAWLLWRYAGKKSPEWITLAQLRAECGTSANDKNFRDMLRDALDKISMPIDSTPHITSFEFTRGTKAAASALCVHMSHFADVPAATPTGLNPEVVQ